MAYRDNRKTSEEFKALLKEYGASDQQTETQVAEIAEKAVNDIATERLEGLAISKLEKIHEEAQKEIIEEKYYAKQAQKLTESLEPLIEEARKMESMIEGLKYKMDYMPDGKSANAMLIFEEVLTTTKKVFGDDISDDVMKAAITAGSYGMWRSIMGEK